MSIYFGVEYVTREYAPLLMWSGCSKSALPRPRVLVNGLVVMPLGAWGWGVGGGQLLSPHAQADTATLHSARDCFWAKPANPK